MRSDLQLLQRGTDNSARYQTSIAGWSLAVAATLSDFGFDASAIFHEAGIDLEGIHTASDRLPVSAVQRVWQFANANAGDCFGVGVSRHLTPGSLHALGFALWCSASMKDFFERYIRYRCVLSHMHFCELIDEGDSYRLSLVDERKLKTEITNDAASGFFLRMARQMGAGDFAPRSLLLTRTLGAERTELESFFRTNVQENSDAYAMIFSRHDLEAKLPFANPALARQQDDIVERYIADNGLISEYMLRVRTAIQELLIEGTVNLEHTAERLHVSARTLQRRLTDEASSYNQLLDEVRHQLALDYCRAPRATATEIAFRLGFTDSGSFGRCFRRWTGESFTTYRQQASAGAKSSN